MKDIAVLSEKDMQYVLEKIENPMVKRIMLSISTKRVNFLFLPTDQIQKQKITSSYKLIKGKARLDKGTKRSGSCLEVDCFVAYRYWDQLGPLQGESMDIIQYFDKMLPQASRKTIGAFTAMNGIQNDKKNFENMCRSIVERLRREKSLFIGIS